MTCDFGLVSSFIVLLFELAMSLSLPQGNVGNVSLSEFSAKPRTPDWIHCTTTASWLGQPPMTLGELGRDCVQAYEWMDSVDIQPNWGRGNIFEFVPVGEQPVLGLPVMRVPRRYTHGDFSHECGLIFQRMADLSRRCTQRNVP